VSTELWNRYRQAVSVVLALVVPLCVSSILVPYRGTFANTAAALVLVAFIVALSIAGNRLTGFIASLSSALWFDFFLTRPYDTFDISHRLDIETTISIIVVGFMVTELAARSRHHSRVSNEEARYVATIHDLADLAANPTPSPAVVESASASLVELLDLRACRFERAATQPPLPRILSDGTVEHVGLQWPVGELGIPGPEAEIVAEWRGHVLGRFVLTPTPGRPVSRERRIVAVALTTLVAATLDRERRVV